MTTLGNKPGGSQKPRRPRRRRRQIVLRANMREIQPPIWRRIRVPEDFSLNQLHRVLQIVFSRLDYHLYSFDVGERIFSFPDLLSDIEFEDATAAKLADLALGKGDVFKYTYDFGDDWEHDLIVEGFLPMPRPHVFDWTPRLLGGERAAPPEDAGGSHGYELMLEALNNPGHEEHESYRNWAGPLYDPERFDPWAIDAALTLAVKWSDILTANLD
jgi:hypothetical protein